MRWIWIDRFEVFEPGRRAVAVKNVSLAEGYLHEHFPGFPVLPASLMIEGMAQTGGILVGQAADFQEKVILAKIGRAEFFRLVRPGEQVVYIATLVRISPAGASIEGRISARSRSADGHSVDLAVGHVELMFSHIDQNRAGLKFPEFNFVFNARFMSLYENWRRGVEVALQPAPSHQEPP